jgi:hypothetical protein
MTTLRAAQRSAAQRSAAQRRRVPTRQLTGQVGGAGGWVRAAARQAGPPTRRACRSARSSGRGRPRRPRGGTCARRSRCRCGGRDGRQLARTSADGLRSDGEDERARRDECNMQHATCGVKPATRHATFATFATTLGALLALSGHKLERGDCAAARVPFGVRLEREPSAHSDHTIACHRASSARHPLAGARGGALASAKKSAREADVGFLPLE